MHIVYNVDIKYILQVHNHIGNQQPQINGTKRIFRLPDHPIKIIDNQNLLKILETNRNWKLDNHCTPIVKDDGPEPHSYEPVHHKN